LPLFGGGFSPGEVLALFSFLLAVLEEGAAEDEGAVLGCGVEGVTGGEGIFLVTFFLAGLLTGTLMAPLDRVLVTFPLPENEINYYS